MNFPLYVFLTNLFKQILSCLYKTPAIIERRKFILLVSNKCVIEKVISVDNLQKFYCYPSGKSKTIVTEDSKEDCKFVKWVACKTNVKGNF